MTTKIRGIKPEIWTDEKFIDVSPLARLLFISLMNHSCDNGHVADRPRQIKLRCLPADSVDVDDLLAELVEVGLIERSDGWVKIPNLPRHQKIDRRYLSLCAHCAHDENAHWKEGDRMEKTTGTRRAPVVSTPGTRCAPVTDGDGDGDSDGDGDAKGSKPGRKRPARTIPDDWEPNAQHIKKAQEKNLDLEYEAERFRNYFLALGKKYADWDAAFRNWLNNDKARTKKPTRNPDIPEGW